MEQKIKVRLRLVIINDGKLLATYNSQENFYYYLGGKLDFGETVEEAWNREIKEECPPGTQFTFQKILYVRDFIQKENNEHSLELFVLGSVNKSEDLEKYHDPEHGERNWSTWLDINNLPVNLYPQSLSKKLLADFKNGFPREGEYIGQIK